MTSYDWPTILTYATLISGLVIQALRIKELKLRIKVHEITDQNKRAVLVRPTDDEVKLYGKQPERTNLDSGGKTEKTATGIAATVKLVTGSEESEQKSRTTVDQKKRTKADSSNRPFWILNHAFACVVIISLICFSWFEIKRTVNAEDQLIRTQVAEIERKRREDENRIKSFAFINNQIKGLKFEAGSIVATPTWLRKQRLTKTQKKNSPLFADQQIPVLNLSRPGN